MKKDEEVEVFFFGTCAMRGRASTAPQGVWEDTVFRVVDGGRWQRQWNVVVGDRLTQMRGLSLFLR